MNGECETNIKYKENVDMNLTVNIIYKTVWKLRYL